jgi:tRNA pseudouridine55 synthase
MRTPDSPFGLLNVNKPTGISSRQTINPLQRRLKPIKVGHAGTLDPLARGVLVVTVGRATRLTSLLHTWAKRYHATFLLGYSSETDDIEGPLIQFESALQPSLEALQQAAFGLTGVIRQRPPAYSALKVQGRRAYALARAGQVVELAERTVTIHELTIAGYSYPHLEIQIRCSSGNYIRAVGRDLAEAVGTRAVMTHLTRTAIGHLSIDRSIDLSTLEANDPMDYLLPATEAVAGLPQLVLDGRQQQQVARGQSIDVLELTAPLVAALTADGQLAALLIPRGPQRYGPQCNFLG